MSDHAQPMPMNESDLWLMFYKLRIEHPFRDLFNGNFAEQLLTEHGGKAHLAAGGSTGQTADADLEDFRRRYPHRIYDDKEPAK